MFRALALGAVVVVGCGPGNRENSAVCGFASMAGASMVLEQLRTSTKVLTEPPRELAGIVPARVVGFGTARAIAAEGPDGIVVGYEGQGFPRVPGFGLALVEDSADTFKGILIFETDPPYGYQELGVVASDEATLPLYGLRVPWGAVSDPRCPLFGELDTAGSRPGS